MILEKPFYSDDLLSEPLHETSGFYLRKLFKQADLSIYVTFLAKCYQKSTIPKVFKTCANTCKQSWLDKEISDFTHILLMGKSVAESFSILKKSENIQEMAGQKIPSSGKIWWLWYSESFVFNRGKKIERETLDLFKRIKNEMEVLES